MLRDLEFRPEGETTFQPRATPWEPGFQGSACPVRAPQFSAVAMSQSHVKNRILFRPFRAGTWLLDVVPGRCPGLICDCPFGATTQKAQHQNALARARTPRNHHQPRSLARESSRRDANRLRRSVLATHRIMDACDKRRAVASRGSPRGEQKIPAARDGAFQAAAATDRKAFNRLRMPLHCANDAVLSNFLSFSITDRAAAARRTFHPATFR